MAEQIQNFDLATPEQAEAVYEAVELTALLSGEDGGTRYIVPSAPVIIPDAIAEHFPKTDSDFVNPKSTMTITQFKDSESGFPVTRGLLGKVSFDQTETRDEGMPRIRSVSYFVTSEGGRVRQLERRNSVVDGDKYVPRTIGERILDLSTGPVSNETAVSRQEAQAILGTLSEA